MRIEFTEELKVKLRAIRGEQLAGAFLVDDFLRNNEVVGLTLGLGPRVYLRLDGKVILWDTDQLWLENWEPHISEEMSDVVGALVHASEKFNEAEFLKLLPPMPEDGKTCTLCKGNRRWIPNDAAGKPCPPGIICPECKGLAWTRPAEL